jgi:hypothetical protein
VGATNDEEKTPRGWSILDRDRAILYRQYHFGRGLATTMVFRGAGDGLIVMSPGARLEEAALDELSDYGKVVALVASNAYHWLGQRAWSQRFPDARRFAPEQGIARLAKVARDAGRFEPLEALQPLLGEYATVVDGMGLKVGNAFATVRGARGTFYYPSDFLSNLPPMPAGAFVFKALLSMTNSGPGFRLFRPSVWLQVKDKKAFGGWLEQEIAKAGPATIVPAHGAPVHGTDLVASARSLIAQM